MSTIQLKRLRNSALEPKYAHDDDACFDLFAAENVSIKSGKTELVPLGFAMGIPVGWQVAIRPRSGMSLKTPLRLANSPGTIDSGYNGEVNIIMHNTGDKTVSIVKGDRIAQGSLERVNKAHFTFVEQLSPTDRDKGGFGSTGV